MRVRCPECGSINELPAESSGLPSPVRGLPRGSESDSEAEPAANDLWDELSVSEVSRRHVSQPPAPSRRNNPWLYVMMGFAAAVPVVVLLFIVAQWIVHSLESEQQSPPTNRTPALSTPENRNEQQTEATSDRPTQTWGIVADGDHLVRDAFRRLFPVTDWPVLYLDFPVGVRVQRQIG
jgi:hypothetical protein